MTDWNTNAVFDALEQSAMVRIIEGIARESRDYQDRVRKFLEDFLDNAFPFLADIVASDLGDAPGWAPQWEQYRDPFYQNRKLDMGRGFAHYRGGGIAGLRALGGRREDIFGTVTLTIEISIGGTVQRYSYDRRNRLRFAKGAVNDIGRKIGGRFAKTIPELKNVRVGLGIIPPSKDSIGSRISPEWVQNNVSKSMRFFEYGRQGKLKPSSFFTRSGRREMVKQGEQPARPLIRPFLEWYLNDYLNAQMRKQLGAR